MTAIRSTRARTPSEGQDLFDQAVSCDGNTITFKLNQPVPDFNFTTTLGMSAVRIRLTTRC